MVKHIVSVSFLGALLSRYIIIYGVAGVQSAYNVSHKHYDKSYFIDFPSITIHYNWY